MVSPHCLWPLQELKLKGSGQQPLASVADTLQMQAADRKLGCELVERFPGTHETLGLIPRADFKRKGKDLAGQSKLRGAQI